MNLEVRLATEADLDELIALYEAISAEVSGTDNDPVWEVGVYPTVDELRSFINAGEFYVGTAHGRIAGALVATKGGEVDYEGVSWQSAIPVGESTIIHLFGMHPGFRGSGLARPLMDAVQADLRQRGDRILRLDVIAENVGAQRVYDRFGFTKCDTAWLEYPDYQGEFVFYEKEL